MFWFSLSNSVSAGSAADRHHAHQRRALQPQRPVQPPADHVQRQQPIVCALYVRHLNAPGPAFHVAQQFQHRHLRPVTGLQQPVHQHRRLVAQGEPDAVGELDPRPRVGGEQQIAVEIDATVL